MSRNFSKKNESTFSKKKKNFSIPISNKDTTYIERIRIVVVVGGVENVENFFSPVGV
jgi:hypothetical protein